MTTQLLNQVEQGLVYILVLGALFLVKLAVSELKKVSGHVKTFVVAHTTEKERTLLNTLVKDAVPYFKTLYPDLNPADLIQKATDHVTALTVQKGLSFNPQEVSAAVGALLSVLSATEKATAPNISINATDPAATAQQVAQQVSQQAQAAPQQTA